MTSNKTQHVDIRTTAENRWSIMEDLSSASCKNTLCDIVVICSSTIYWLASLKYFFLDFFFRFIILLLEVSIYHFVRKEQKLHKSNRDTETNWEWTPSGLIFNLAFKDKFMSILGYHKWKMWRFLGWKFDHGILLLHV